MAAFMAIEPSLQLRDSQAGTKFAAGFAPARGRFSSREAMNAVGVAERRAKPTADFRLKRRSATRGQRLGNIVLCMVPPGIPLNQVNNAYDE